MQALKELAYLVNRNKIKSLDSLINPLTGNSKTAALYAGVLDNKFESDDEAALFFYGSDKQHSSYQKLKASLKNRLIDMMFFIDVKQPSYTDRQKAYYGCYKDWAAVKVLLGKNARISAIGLSHKILKYARQYEFTELAMDVARTLRLHYGAREGDIKKYDIYNELYKEYALTWQKENQVEERYTELVARYVNNRALKEEIHKKALLFYQEIEEIMHQFDSYRLQLCGNLIRLMIHTSISDHTSTIEICSEAIELFEAKDYTASVPLQIFYYQQLVCHTQLQQYEEGREVAEKCLNLLEEGSFNWFKYQELYYILSMHTGKYEQAYHIFFKVIKHKRFQFLPHNVIELWKIYEAYIHYMYSTGKLNLPGIEKQFNNFRLGKFLNTTPIYSKDKRGMNIPILIIQILFMIQKRKYDQAIDRIEAIDKYCSRYLRKDGTFRSNCFIKMLLQIPISGFHKAGVIRRSKEYLKRLKNMPLEVAGQAHEIEIIPYELLWELALESMENKFYRTQAISSSSK